MASGLTEQYRCGYCLLEFKSMVDPRVLPCSHVFCITCIQADDRKGRGVCCPICQHSYDSNELVDLEKAKLDSQPTTVRETTLLCDCPGCEGKLAIIYCVECANRVCPDHQKSHDSFFGDKHRSVDICVYEQSPENFKKPICEDHSEILIKACIKCDKLICPECDRYEDKCTDDKQHSYSSLKDLAEAMKTHYTRLLKAADIKLVDMSKLEKETWGSLDQEDVQRRDRIEEIERSRDEEIRKITEKSQEYIVKVDGEYKDASDKVEEFTSALLAKKDELEEVRLKVRRLANDGHITEQIRRRRPTTELMQQFTNQSLGSIELESHPLSQMRAIAEADIIDIDRLSLAEECEIINKKTCYDLEITPSGDILLAGNRGFDICDKAGVVQRSIPCKEGDFTSIQCYRSRIYTLLKEPKGSNKRRVVVFDTPSYSECIRWHLPDYGFVSMLAVSNDKVYVVDSDAKNVKIYSLTGDLITDFHHSGFRNPVYMSSCSPNGILLSDWSAGLVYKIDSITDKVAWKFKVSTPRGVFCDPSGNVWVWSSKEKAFFVRAADGQTMKRLNHKLLDSTRTEYICGMFMEEGRLWGAACGKGVICLQTKVVPQKTEQ